MDARFLKSATRKEDYPRSGLPVIAFSGRSNVGKSSLINNLVGRKGLARTSSTPGRTQAINFFEVDGQWMFVDLPGYGYAKVPESIRAHWGPMIEEFLKENAKLKLAVLIVDARHEPTPLDRVMQEWLEAHRIPYRVVATKGDKLSSNQLRRSLRRIEEVLKTDPLPYSAATGMGRKELWQIIREDVKHG